VTLSSERRSWGLAASAFAWLLFLANFLVLTPTLSDGILQYRFVERLYGDRAHADGYYFGFGLVEAPFYGLGKLLESAGVHSVGGHPTRQAVISVGLAAITLAVWPLLGAVLRGLRLRHAGFAILAAALGTPFFFYATFFNGKNHALDTVIFCGVAYLAFRYFRAGRTPERWLPFALGALLGLSYTVRYFSGAEAVMLVAYLAWLRRWRHGLEIAATSAAVCLLLWIVPTVYGVHVFQGSTDPSNTLVLAPLNPLRMLFTNHRGLFVWSPVCVLAVVGLVVLFRRRPEHRRFLTALTLMSVGVVASYALVPYWDGTWSFSQRFFTSLLPIVAVGLAGLLELAPRPAIAGATVCAAWSLYLAFNLLTIGGPQYVSTIPGGASDVALIPERTHTSLGAYQWGIRRVSRLLP
jgi:hypothetical protein